MPETEPGLEPAPALDGVRVVRPAEAQWHDYPEPLPGDVTPEEFGPGQYSPLFESEDGKIYVALWTRAWDEGDVVGEENAIDVILDGSVDVIDADGKTHTASSGDVLLYRGDQGGRWVQKGPITKVFISVKD